MKLKYLIMNAGLSLMMALPAFGASKEMVTVIPRTTGVLEDSSEHKRMNQDYMLTVQPYGFNVAPFISVGLNGGMYLDRNNILQLEYASGLFPLIIVNFKATTVGLNWKHFYGNSFYTKLGVDHRKISLEDYDPSTSSSGEVLGIATALTGNIAIGNQWQWDTFTLGCDWIGYNPSLLPLESHYRTSLSDTNDAVEIESDWKRLAQTQSFQLMRFYLGASF